METTTTQDSKARKIRAKVAHSWGVKDIGKWNFEDNSFPEPWAGHLGDLPQRFIMYVDGEGGSGKTTYQMMMSKMLSNHYGKVRLNNVEQGKHKQIKKIWKEQDFEHTVPAGKWRYCSVNDFHTMVEMLKRPNSGRVQIIDSISYFPLTVEQIQNLIELFRKKSFVFVGYQVHFNQYKAVRHLCDIKVRCENGVATIQGNRFGGGKDFVIWKKHPIQGDQLTIV